MSAYPTFSVDVEAAWREARRLAWAAALRHALAGLRSEVGRAA